MNAMRFGLWTLMILLTACGADVETTSQLSMVVGENEIVPVGADLSLLPAAIQESIGALGQLDDTCTVFHIGEGVVLSAAHCFSEKVQANTACVTHDIHWADGSVSACTEVLYRELDDDQDLFAFVVDPIPADSFTIAETSFRAIGEELVIVGYPAELDLSMATGCSATAVTPGSPRFEHNCDSLPGNSGSPIFSKNSGEIIGVHNGSAAPFNYGTALAGWFSTLDELTRNYQDKGLNSGDSLVVNDLSDNEKPAARVFPRWLWSVGAL